MHDTYVRDARHLGLNRFFEQVHPSAQLQIVNRMLETIRRDYWRADDATRRSLEQRRAALQTVVAAADRASEHRLAEKGFGLAPKGQGRPRVEAAPARPAEAPAAVSPPPPAPRPLGRILERQRPAPAPAPPSLRGQLPALAAILLLFLAGLLLEARGRRSLIQEKDVHARA